MLLTNHEDAGLLTIAGSLDISHGDELREALRVHVQAHPSPSLDLSGVEACDAAILQLLWSAHRTATHEEKRLAVTAWSGAVRQAGAAVGVSFEELEAENVHGI